MMGDHDEQIKKEKCNLTHEQLQKLLVIVKEAAGEKQNALDSIKKTIVKTSKANGLEEQEVENSIHEQQVLVSLSTKERTEKEGSMCEKLIEKIKNGSYSNICSQCNEYIDFERLEYMPWTKLCRKCNKRLN